MVEQAEFLARLRAVVQVASKASNANAFATSSESPNGHNPLAAAFHTIAAAHLA